MIAGAGMLIAVAVEAGTIEALSTWIGSNVPKPLVPIAFCLVGAIMSFFSSTTGVVAPALFPLIPNLAASVGLPRRYYLPARSLVPSPALSVHFLPAVP